MYELYNINNMKNDKRTVNKRLNKYTNLNILQLRITTNLGRGTYI